MKHIRQSLTIAIPAYNEEASLSAVVKNAVEAARSVTSDYEIVIVDDGSTDTTGHIADLWAKQNSKVKVFHHPHNKGFSGAIKSCYLNATKELIFLLPADGQIDAMDVRLFLQEIDHADVVVGYRKKNPEPLGRRINSYVFHTLYRFLFGVTLKEISTSILWRRSALRSIDITASSRSALIEPEVVYKAWDAGFRFAEVSIPYYPRKGGKAKGSNPIMILATLKELLRLWWSMRITKRRVHAKDSSKM